jgi:hypothetical protein
LTPSRNGVRRAVREGAAVEQRAAYRSYARRYRAQTKELRAVAAPPNVTAQEELFATLDQIGDAYVVLGRQAGTKKGETATTAVYRLGLQRNDQAASLGAAACAGI